MSRPSAWETKQLTDLIRDQLLWEEASWDLREYIGKLPDDNDEALRQFCDRYELGNWFFEALQLHDVCIADLLEEIAVEHQQQEHEAERDRADQERELRQMQSPDYPS
jgi:hypothetical protein